MVWAKGASFALNPLVSTSSVPFILWSGELGPGGTLLSAFRDAGPKVVGHSAAVPSANCACVSGIEVAGDRGYASLWGHVRISACSCEGMNFGTVTRLLPPNFNGSAFNVGAKATLSDLRACGGVLAP